MPAADVVCVTGRSIIANKTLETDHLHYSNIVTVVMNHMKAECTDVLPYGHSSLSPLRNQAEGSCILQLQL